MVSKIALEEHFLFLDFIEYWSPTVVDLPTQRRDKALSRLTDFGEMRLTAMNEAGIARAVLALAGPGVQAERDGDRNASSPCGQRFFGPRDRQTAGLLFGLRPPRHAGCPRRGRRTRALHTRGPVRRAIVAENAIKHLGLAQLAPA